MDKDKVLQLASLARIKISDTEATNLSEEFEGILSYVSEIEKAEGKTNNEKKPENFSIKNVIREDANPNPSGEYTEILLNEAPAREGNYFKVKKIL
jgi:aspartyl/glutamyl-tRNA(Asn/Gln) amidotransferase C subunit